jgi:hypothetical protein
MTPRRSARSITPDAVSVFAVGEVAIGRDAIMEALAPYFEAKVARWSWTEITRSVQGCRTGVIVYRTLVERPGLSRHAVNTVTYTFDRGAGWSSRTRAPR